MSLFRSVSRRFALVPKLNPNGCHPYALRSISSASNDIEAKELNDSKDAEKEKEHQARLDAKDIERTHVEQRPMSLKFRPPVIMW